MVVKVYHDIVSPPVRAVHFTIKHLDIPVEFVNVSLMTGEHKSEEYLKVNPEGTVPAIDDDGFVLVDSHAINIYLATKYAEKSSLYPSDHAKRAVVNHRLFYETGDLFAHLKNAAKRIFLKGATSIDEESAEKFENGYKGLEVYLEKSAYIAGDELTIADFSVITTMASMRELVPVNKEKFPLLTAYLERATKLPHYAEINGAGIARFKEVLKAKNFNISQ